MVSKIKENSIWPTLIIIIVLLAFSGLIYGGSLIYRESPPIPDQVLDNGGRQLFTAEDIQGGQAVFLRFGLMNFGTVFGHGGYLAPDFTADYLHSMAVQAQHFHSRQKFNRAYAELDQESQAAVDNLVTQDLKANRYNPQTGTLQLSAAQTQAYQFLSDYYFRIFTEGNSDWGIPKGLVPAEPPGADNQWHSPKPLARQLGDYFAWSAWVAAANRPGLDYSFTNNWPPDKLAGNLPTRDALIWSVASVGILLLFLGLILYIYVKYKFEAEHADLTHLPAVETFNVTPSQLKTAKFFVVVAALFLLQTLVGSLSAHYFVEKQFFGIPVENLIPFNLARTWHLQLAIFWIATSWVAGGIFLAPLVGGKEPKAQGLLVDILFAAIVLVAVGSLLGEALGIKNLIGKFWFLLGNQGWEYVELGRIWQILLILGLTIWLFIVYRAIKYRLVMEGGRSSLTHLLLYASVTIPLFYASGLMFNPNTNFAIADFWRWFVIHLWVESFFEFFAVVATAYLMVTLGLVDRKSATRAVYFTLALVFAAGIEGIGHHYWWVGSPAAWIGIGAVFSALEVIPLTLLIFDAVGNINLRRKLGFEFHYRSAVAFLVAAAAWNFVGAGVLGFMINLPIVSYYEHGTYLTPVHGHASMMGTYGMLGLAIMIFALRTIVQPRVWKENRIHLALVLLNVGLILMLALNLIPVGFMQLAASFDQGTWYARSFDFLSSPSFIALTWARLPGDVIFILGALLLLVEVVRMVFHLRPAGTDFKR